MCSAALRSLWHITRTLLNTFSEEVTTYGFDDTKKVAILPLPPFSNFVQPSSLFPPTPTPTAHFVVLFLLLNGWLHNILWAILLNDITDVHMSSFRTLIHVLCNKEPTFSVHWGIKPSLKTPTPFFNQVPLKSTNCLSPSFWAIPPYILAFYEPLPKNWIFRWTLIIFHP